MPQTSTRRRPAPTRTRPASVGTYRKSRPTASFGELRSAVLGDALFGAGSRALAEAHAAHVESATFRYEFARRSEALDGAPGATHAMEIPFVFDLARLPQRHGPNALLGPVRPPADLAADMHSAWVRFVTTGDPGWPPYDTERRATMCIAAEWSVLDDPRGQERRAWTLGSRPERPVKSR